MKSRNDSYLKGRQRSFAAAFKGIPYILKESNFKIHTGLGLLSLVGAYLFHFNLLEWIIVLLCIIFIFTLEAFNTAIEYLVDFISPEQNEKVGKIKDIAAAAVLIGAIGVAVVGVLLFGQKVLMHCGF